MPRENIKWRTIIPQIGIQEYGLLDKTDCIDWVILDFLRGWYASVTKKVNALIKQNKPVDLPYVKFNPDDGKYYAELNYKYVMQNNPILKLKSKGALSARISKIRRLGLIKTIPGGNGLIYFIPTAKLYEIYNYLPEPEPVQVEEQIVQTDERIVRAEKRIVRQNEHYTNINPKINNDIKKENKIILTTTNAVEFFNLNDNAEGKGNWVSGYSTPLANIRGGGPVNLGDVIKGIVEQIKPSLDDPPQENPQAMEQGASPAQVPSPQVGKFREILASIIRTGDLSSLYSNRLYRTTNWGYFEHPCRPEVKTTVNQMLMDVLCLNRRVRRLVDLEELVAMALNDALMSGELPWEIFAKVYRRWQLSGVDKIMWFIKALASEMGVNLNRPVASRQQPKPQIEEKIPEELV